MKRAIFLAFASIGFAQTQPDAMALLRGVASLAQSNNRWLIEGVTAASGEPEKATFSLRRESAKEVRFESHGGADPLNCVRWDEQMDLFHTAPSLLTDAANGSPCVCLFWMSGRICRSAWVFRFPRVRPTIPLAGSSASVSWFAALFLRQWRSQGLW